MKKRLLTLFSLLLIFISAADAQEDLVLKQQLQGKTNLNDVMSVINTYYKNPETINRLGQRNANRDLKHWKRWEWYMSSRIGINGDFVNINQKLIEATGLQQNRSLRSAGTSNNLSNATQTASGNWTLVGPNNTTVGIGRVDRLAFHPTDADIVYAGSAGGGLWRTTNAGTSWSNLTPDIPCLGISGIAINPENTNNIYILTGDGDSNTSGLVDDFGYMRLSIGVLKTTNGGASWTKMGVFPGANYSTLVGYRLTMHPTNPDTLFACTNQGIFRTGDGGTSWTLVEDEGRFYNLKFKPGSSTICYAVSLDGNTAKFFKSTNSGNTFVDDPVITGQINNPTSRVDLAVAPSNSSVVYILCGGVQNAGGTYKGLFRSGDSGDSFVSQSNSPNILGRASDGSDNASQSSYDLTVAVSNITSNTVVVGAIETWRSLDAGANWAFRGTGIHEDVHEVGFHPADNKLWVANDGGVFSSTDNGANWTTHFEGMSNSQFYRIDVNPDDYIEIIGGLQDNGTKKRNGNTSTFDRTSGADGFTVGYDNANSSIFYAVINSTITRFTNGGSNSIDITPPNTNNFAPSMAVHTSLGNALFFAADSFWRTTNAISPNTWTMTPNLNGGWFIRTCPSNGNRVYMAGGNSYQATSGVLRRSDDGGATWAGAGIISNNPGFPNSYPKITSINVDPNNSNNVWVTFGGYMDGVKVYYSNDAGANWFPRNGTLPNLPINCIAIDINNNAYIGTDNGVYYRSTTMTDWVPFYNNLPYVPITDLILSEADNRIRASTFGRGVWSSDLYSTCVTDLNITGTLEGQEFHEASNNISSTASLLTSEGSKVQMRGGNEVLLQPGFTAREMTSFRAAIGPCGSGGVAGFFVSEINSLTKLPSKHFLPPPGGKRSMIHIHSVSNGLIQFEVNQKYNGETDVVITNEAGAIVSTKNFPSTQTGKWNNTISTTGLQPGLYYLSIMLDKRVEHMQELVIR